MGSAGGIVAARAFVPVLLVDFADNPAERTRHTQAEFQNMLFGEDYPAGAGSLRQ